MWDAKTKMLPYRKKRSGLECGEREDGGWRGEKDGLRWSINHGLSTNAFIAAKTSSVTATPCHLPQRGRSDVRFADIQKIFEDA